MTRCWLRRSKTSGPTRVRPSNASQHFSVLRAKQIVVNRKEGNQVFYSLRSPLLIEVLDTMRRYFHEQLTETMAALGEIEKEQGEAR